MGTQLVTHKATGLCVDPRHGRVYRADGKTATVVTDDGCSVVMVRSGRGDSATVYATARIVYEAVHGPLPTGMRVQKVNDIRSDNRLENLYAVEATP